jgi:streptogramin lyase
VILRTDTQVDVGSEFLGYRIEELIGRGGMGVVYRAYDLRLKRTVALKLVAPELAVDERFRERFARETELTMSLEHPNVVPIHDAGDYDGRLFLAMRLVEGTDLGALLRAEGALDPPRTLAICAQVANALDAAHAKGLVHRDVKPSNVLLDENEHVYLADFGLTRRLEEQGAQTGDGRSVGTPAYLAPEQIEGESVDGRADVYSLGCLLFECLTGEAPYVRGSRLAVAWAHMEEEPPRTSEHHPGLPQAVDSVIAKAMAKDPDDRYATCGALLQAGGEALGLSRPSRLGRRRLALLVAGVLVALAATLAALIATRGGRAPVSSPLFARPNTLARIDPATNAVSDVIPVGNDPVATAARGNSVWVYNLVGETISEIDPASRKARETTPVPVFAKADNVFAGPDLVADAGGAWLVGLDSRGRGGVLTRVRRGGATRYYRLRDEPRGVGVGFGAVWIVGRGQHGSELLRIDPSTGRVTRSRRFRSELDSIGVGDGAVYVVGGSEGTLYRIDPRSPRLKLIRQANLGGRASRPLVTSDFLAFLTTELGGTGLFLDPVTLKEASKYSGCCPPQWGEQQWSHGWLWWSDWPTGSVYRLRTSARSRDYRFGPPHAIHVTKLLPEAVGPCLTSIDIGEGAVWVTAVAPTGVLCSP